MPRLEIYYQRDPADPTDDGWVCRIDGSIYEGGGHIPGTEDLGPDDLAEAVAAWLRSQQPIGAPCMACGTCTIEGETS